MKKNNSLDEVQLKLLDRNIIDIAGEVDMDTAWYVRESLNRLIARDSPDINIKITSPGGSVGYGLDIYDGLRLYQGKVTGQVFGKASSIAAVILQACDTRLCCLHSEVMIHSMYTDHVRIDDLTTAKIRDKNIKEWTALNNKILKILANRTKRSISSIRKQCKLEETLTAQEALKFNLIDKII